MTHLIVVGTAQQVREKVYQKTINLLDSKAYRDNPDHYGLLVNYEEAVDEAKEYLGRKEISEYEAHKDQVEKDLDKLYALLNTGWYEHVSEFHQAAKARGLALDLVSEAWSNYTRAEEQTENQARDEVNA